MLQPFETAEVVEGLLSTTIILSSKKIACAAGNYQKIFGITI